MGFHRTSQAQKRTSLTRTTQRTPVNIREPVSRLGLTSRNQVALLGNYNNKISYISLLFIDQFQKCQQCSNSSLSIPSAHPTCGPFNLPVNCGFSSIHWIPIFVDFVFSKKLDIRWNAISNNTSCWQVHWLYESRCPWNFFHLIQEN